MTHPETHEAWIASFLETTNRKIDAYLADPMACREEPERLDRLLSLRERFIASLAKLQADQMVSATPLSNPPGRAH